MILLIGCSEKREFPKMIQLDKLKSTDFVFTTNQKIAPEKNQIYCPTLLFAWNHLKEKTNSVLESENEIANIIDNSNNYINSLNEDEYSKSISIENNFIRVKSEFNKSLPFSEEFTRNNIDLKFSDNQKIESFGCNHCKRKTKSQIKVVHFKNQEDFAIKISPKDETNEILLYRPNNTRSTLGEYYDDLRKKMSKEKNDKNWWRYSYLEEDVFEAPIIKFNIETEVKELRGVQLNSRSGSIEIEEVKQRIALIFDEKGAEIESEAEILAKAADAGMDRPIPKKLVFDKSFLLVFKKKEFKNPYFLAWISNSELMKKKENY